MPPALQCQQVAHPETPGPEDGSPERRAALGLPRPRQVLDPWPQHPGPVKWDRRTNSGPVQAARLWRWGALTPESGLWSQRAAAPTPDPGHGQGPRGPRSCPGGAGLRGASRPPCKLSPPACQEPAPTPGTHTTI